MKIVAWRMGFAGDVLFSTAALEAIKRKYRRSEVTYGVWAQYANLIATNPYIDKFVHSDGVEDKVVGTDEMGYPIVRKVVRKDGLEYAKRQAHKVWEISHEKYPMPQGEMIYWGEIHARQAAELKLLELETMTSFKPQVYLNTSDVIARPKGTRIATLGAFSKNGADSRLWGMHRGRWDRPELPGPKTAELYTQALAAVGERWLFDDDGWPALVQALNGMGFQCIQLGGQGDPRIPGAPDLCGKLSWRQSVGAVMQADLCITIDSFLLHAALARKYALDGSVLSDGTPTVALLGPIDGRGLFPVDAEQVVEVQARPHEECPCFHSSRFGRGPCQHGNACMKGITVEMIIEGVERCLNE